MKKNKKFNKEKRRRSGISLIGLNGLAEVFLKKGEQHHGKYKEFMLVTEGRLNKERSIHGFKSGLF